MLKISLLIASLVMLGLAVVLRASEPGMRRWQRIASAVVFTVGFALVTVILIALLEHTFSSSFARFPLRLLKPGAPY